MLPSQTQGVFILRALRAAGDFLAFAREENKFESETNIVPLALLLGAGAGAVQGPWSMRSHVEGG